MKLTIYWQTNNAEHIGKIRKRFGITGSTSVNGETTADIKDEDIELLKECANRGFIQIRHKR